MKGSERPDENDRREMLLVIESISSLDSDEVIIVEGEKDRVSLRNLGVASEIYVINDGKSIVETSEILARKYHRAIILMDWDRTGGRLARALSEQFISLGMEFSLKERKELSFLCKKDIKDVESLYGYLESG